MKTEMMNILMAACVSMFAWTSCTQDSPVTNPLREDTVVRAERGSFAKGADVSWITQMETEGVTFSNRQGVETECMQLLRDDCGVNAIRLRVWVNPSDGWNNIDDVLVKARRADALGLRVMIDFHFSDTWADPAAQTIPAAWADYSLEDACTAVSRHVTEMLSKLKIYGVEPEWVQIGNETRTGMMWPLGKIDQDDNYAKLNNAGYDAVKAIFPDCQVIVHLDSGDNIGLYTRVFKYMKNNGGEYDIIGMSLYPEVGQAQSAASTCLQNINTLYSTYGKSVMICEIGMNYDAAEECRDCIRTLMSGSEHLLGIFYWEPEAPAGYNGGYNKGCFDNSQPTVALDGFKD
jgi:arabinogalactan endo-1,4-beta-galactosidase